MKQLRFKNLMLVGLALSCLFASCKKETPNTDPTNPDLNLDGIYFDAVVEADDANGNDRTYLVGNNIRWKSSDQIFLRNSNNQEATFELVVGADSQEGRFYTGNTFSRTPRYWSAYPRNKVTAFNTSNYKATFNMPQQQSLDNGVGSFGNGTMPMVATSTNNKLYFKNVFGGICFPLAVEDGMTGYSVKKITLTSNNTSEKLWGVFTADCTSSTPSPTYVSGGSNVVELTCNVPLTTTAKDFIIMIPPGTLKTGFTVQVYDQVGSTYVQIYKKQITFSSNSSFIQRSRIRKVQGTVKIGMGFSVSESQRVLFSLGNLQWSAKNGNGQGSNTTHTVAGGGTAPGTFRFSEHPWDFVGGQRSGRPQYGNVYHTNASGSSVRSMNDNRAQNYEGWIDLFAWGADCWPTASGGVTKYMPYEQSLTYSHYYLGNNANNSMTGNYAKGDWGVFNAIWNPARNAYDAPGTWRTLLTAEWDYLLRLRSVPLASNIRYGKVKISSLPNSDDVYGLVIVPDEWDATIFNLSQTGIYGNYQSITLNDWYILAKAGCVFLPGAGDMDNNNGALDYDHHMVGYYWSATAKNDYYACDISFSEGFLVGGENYSAYGDRYNYGERTCPRAVRLAKNISY